ncbi:MAG: hypothetical protein M1820_001405 [Bogoriella megaspora]|nr:MAG: hypothetical protein M1820_001405 [Bogoriella megaspora]
MSLTILPDELLAKIVEYAGIHYKTEEAKQRCVWMRLISVSRRFRSITTESLYSDFWCRDKLTCWLFVRSLLENKHLQTLVRVIRLGYRYTMKLEDFDPVELMLWRKADEELPDDQNTAKRHKPQLQLFGNGPPAQIKCQLTSLLTLTPRVCTIQAQNCYWPNQVIAKIIYDQSKLNIPDGLSHGFSWLESLSLCIAAIPRDHLEGLFHLPSLRSLGFEVKSEVRPVTPRLPEMDLAAAGVRFSSITGLNFEGHEVRSCALATCIQACKGVTHFRYQPSNIDTDLTLASISRFDIIGDALMMHKDTLEDLVLEPDFGWGGANAATPLPKISTSWSMCLKAESHLNLAQ